MTTKSDSMFKHTYDIRSYEPSPGGRAPITVICDQLQDIASRHADAMGFGFSDLKEVGHFWMLARLCLRMDRLPGFGDTCHVTTWPSANERLVASRDFLIRDRNELIGRSTSNWVAVNLETHRASPPDKVLDARLIPDIERALKFPSKAIKRLKEGETAASITARRSDQDINNHVNSVRYAEFCLEAVPADWAATHNCLGLDIQFRNESYAGDTYSAACSVTGQDDRRETMLHSLTRTSDGKEIVRMKTWWGRN